MAPFDESFLYPPFFNTQQALLEDIGQSNLMPSPIIRGDEKSARVCLLVGTVLALNQGDGIIKVADIEDL